MSRLAFIYSLGFVAAACSDGGRREPAREPDLAADLRLPDTSTSVAPAPRPVTRPADTIITPRKPTRPKRVVRAPAAREDTTPQGYAPNVSRDTAVPDSVGSDTLATDTHSVADTVAGVDRSATQDTLASADTVSPIEQATPPTVDTSAATPPPPPPPQARASEPQADTALTPTPDSTVGRDTLATTPPPTASASTANRTLPVGTEIAVSLDDSISSRRDTVGQPLSAHVMEEIKSQTGETLIRSGAPVRLTITKLEPAKSRSGSGKITFRVDGIEVGGRLRKISADVRPVSRELRGRGVTGEDVAKVGVGAAGGAVLGRVIGGNTKGAVIGGVVGAAGGAVIAQQTARRDVIVKARTPLVFVLTEPLVTP